jgi:hypothetical protein
MKKPRKPQMTLAVTMSTHLDDPFDIDSEEGTPARSLIPAGRYSAEIVEANVGMTKTGRGQKADFNWQITDGNYAQRMLFQTVLLTHDSEEAQRIGRAMFKDICIACGFTSGKIDDVGVLLFKACTISVGIEKSRDDRYPDDRNRVTRVMPLVRWNGPPPVAPSDTPPPVTPAEAVKAASETQPAFTATGEPLNDEIPF